MNMFFILHIIFGCQKNIGKFFIICIHSFCSICIRRQYFKPKCTIVFLHGFFFIPNIIYTCLYIYLHVYIIKFTKVNITSMTSRLKLHTDTCLTPGTGVQLNHESFPQSFKYTARINSKPPWGPRCHRN